LIVEKVPMEPNYFCEILPSILKERKEKKEKKRKKGHIP
jgi:hypothetical protein